MIGGLRHADLTKDELLADMLLSHFGQKSGSVTQAAGE